MQYFIIFCLIFFMKRQENFYLFLYLTATLMLWSILLILSVGSISLYLCTYKIVIIYPSSNYFRVDSFNFWPGHSFTLCKNFVFYDYMIFFKSAIKSILFSVNAWPKFDGLSQSEVITYNLNYEIERPHFLLKIFFIQAILKSHYCLKLY